MITLEEIKERAPDLWEFIQEIKKHFGSGVIKEIKFRESAHKISRRD